jgi:diguanylate cyclase (GGDEF)-like protein
MSSASDTGRLERFLEFASACSSLSEFDALIRLMVQRAPYLVEFERLTILLCDDSRQIQRAIEIKGHTSREVSPDEIQLSEMDLFLKTLIDGSVSRSAAGLCTPMMAGGHLVGVLFLAAKCERYTLRDAKLIRYLSDSLAGAFGRCAQRNVASTPDGATLSAIDAHEASVAKTHAVSLHMSHMAQHDTLTGLPNRYLLYENLTRALALASRHHRRLAVLFLDLDHFKEINDSLGHAIGDEVLCQLSTRLVGCVRASDTVSRFGGDEFVVLLSEVEDDMAAAVCAQKIITAVTAPLKVAIHDIHPGVSIGISVYPGNGTDAGTMIRSADIAMYRAKSEGRGKFYFFRDEMNVVTHEQGLHA